MKGVGLLAGAVLIVAAYSSFDGTAATAAVVPPELVELRGERAQMALELSEPIATCVTRHDTNHPVFHGCIDWHSAVHGIWALTAYTWATGDQRYRMLIDSTLQPSLLASERQHLLNEPSFEMPYGRAWFLRLALEYHKAFESDILDAFADDVAGSLVAYYASTPPDPASIAYQNAAWALINLYDYGVSRSRAQIVDFVKEQVRMYYMNDAPCPLQGAEVETGEFMAVCTNWAWLVEKVQTREEFHRWIEHFLPENVALEPVSKPSSIHQAGLNFSRAWGLWNIYWKTDDPRFRVAYFRHFNETFSRPALWKGDYQTVAHWVPQFGMFALMVTYYDWP